jgi:hypothetical protein
MSSEKTGVMFVIESLRSLRQDLRDNPEEWQNHTLGDYLRSIESWLEDTQERAPEEPTWEFVAGLFGVGKIYE